MTKVLKIPQKPNYQDDSLSDSQKGIAEVNFAIDCNNFANEVNTKFGGDIEAALDGNKKLAFEVWQIITDQAKKKIYNKARGLAVLLFLLIPLLPSCKVIQREHERLEYREAQQFLEWQKEDLKKPLPIPYSLHEALLSEKGGKQQ